MTEFTLESNTAYAFATADPMPEIAPTAPSTMRPSMIVYSVTETASSDRKKFKTPHNGCFFPRQPRQVRSTKNAAFRTV